MIPRHIKDSYRKYACHEAGHLVIAKLMGFTTDGINLRVDSNGSHIGTAGIHLDQPLNSLSNIESYARKRITILYAGGLAEALVNGNVDNNVLGNIWALSAANDCSKARELIRIVRGIKYPNSTTEQEIQKELNEIEGECLMISGNLVEVHHKIITQIGTRLLEKLSHYGVPALLTQSELNEIAEFDELQ